MRAGLGLSGQLFAPDCDAAVSGFVVDPNDEKQIAELAQFIDDNGVALE